MRTVIERLSRWMLRHPVAWSVGVAALLVVLGVAVDLPPIVIIAAGAAIAVLNIVHARSRGYCPLPSATGRRRRAPDR